MAINEQGKDLRASIPINRPIVYIDLDGVMADFDLRHDELLARGISKKEAFDHPEAYADLPPFEGAIEAWEALNTKYEVYILSTASWDNISSWPEKRLWVEKYLGLSAHKKLILSHNKGLLRGDYLIDDRIANGVSDFQGIHVHFGSAQFPNWKSVIEYLMKPDVLYFNAEPNADKNKQVLETQAIGRTLREMNKEPVEVKIIDLSNQPPSTNYSIHTIKTDKQ